MNKQIERVIKREIERKYLSIYLSVCHTHSYSATVLDRSN